MIVDWKVVGKMSHGPTTCAFTSQHSEAGLRDLLTLAAVLLRVLHHVNADGSGFSPGRGMEDGSRLGSLSP